MPARHSKNAGAKHHYTYEEKRRAGLGTVKERLGTDSQLPFGYCALSLRPAEDPVVSPSGRIYSREFILEYLISKQQELKKQKQAFDAQQAREQRALEEAQQKAQERSIEAFIETHNGVKSTLKRKADEVNASSSVEDAPMHSVLRGSSTALVVSSSSAKANPAPASSAPGYLATRTRIIDDTTREERTAALSRVSPWVPQFTPQAPAAALTDPPKRPPSPFSGRPLRAKDLLPLELIRECEGTERATTKFVCPVSRKTITTQQVVLIRTTGALMIQQVYRELALPTLTCPISGKKFTLEDVLQLQAAASAFSASGQVEVKKHRPNFN
ncbi:hypothetical protein B484DRAFT_444501 [Ochromonadaceae sp. CCMP2298]|nr:hypothetical protein B484DRAFT_444501 [Ochromonadaceae sp. CCMP2298]|eukprot:CAMPEP_0173203762 /NCGR_PEP_ID=MMETSP1141-20130122/19708_1 /TAXON_ID=483371 /ORGANISM="non described non described, Strain CCMP2298" /LENGTH=327 /DNA_ID=CAMNT_0014129273 /DNA_START=7 /DNA_END=990 /DNA_ORIENTATION=+